MKPLKHLNSGKCEKCIQIMDRYPGMNLDLRLWFALFQSKHPEAHISEAGRGVIEQEAAKAKGASKASFGESAHNYNCAIDMFELDGDLNIYEKEWFEKVVAPEIPEYLVWYGVPGSKFFELPHVELRNWKNLRDEGKVKLVEPLPKRKVS